MDNWVACPGFYAQRSHLFKLQMVLKIIVAIHNNELPSTHYTTHHLGTVHYSIRHTATIHGIATR